MNEFSSRFSNEGLYFFHFLNSIVRIKGDGFLTLKKEKQIRDRCWTILVPTTVNIVSGNGFSFL